MCTERQKYVSIQKVSSAGWSSLVARRAHNPKVVGSNPAPATIFKRTNNFIVGPFFFEWILYSNRLIKCM
jgi:hypothetical protein